MERDGIKVPEIIANPPKLQADLEIFLEAFYELDTERNHGMGLARIPGSAIRTYAEEYGLDKEETSFFIRKMDNHHIERLGSRLNHGKSSGPSQMVQRPPRPD